MSAKFSFNRKCQVGVVTPEGDLRSVRFGLGSLVEFIAPLLLDIESPDTRDVVIPDGSILKNVPVDAIDLELSDDSGD